jgi:hypothetical protein
MAARKKSTRKRGSTRSSARKRSGTSARKRPASRTRRKTTAKRSSAKRSSSTRGRKTAARKRSKPRKTTGARGLVKRVKRVAVTTAKQAAHVGEVVGERVAGGVGAITSRF